MQAGVYESGARFRSFATCIDFLLICKVTEPYTHSSEFTIHFLSSRKRRATANNRHINNIMFFRIIKAGNEVKVLNCVLFSFHHSSETFVWWNEFWTSLLLLFLVGINKFVSFKFQSCVIFRSWNFSCLLKLKSINFCIYFVTIILKASHHRSTNRKKEIQMNHA